MPKKTSDKEMIIVAYPETYAHGPCSRSIAPLFIAASMIHINAAAIAPEIKPNIKTILVIVFPPMMLRNLQNDRLEHISQKDDFARKVQFQPKVLRNYTHFFCAGNCLGPPVCIQLRQYIRDVSFYSRHRDEQFVGDLLI